MIKLAHPAARAVAAAALLVALAAGQPARAATLEPTQTPTAGSAASKATRAERPRAERVEARIVELHKRLHITQAQEPLWNNVADAMRDNARTMDAAVKERARNAKNLNAVEDLRSYGAVVEAHADSIRKFVPVFQALYDNMSDRQRTNADTVFRARMHTAQKGK